MLWSASGGLLNQRSINIAERARQARELDDVLRSFDSDEEEDCGGEDGWEAASLGSRLPPLPSAAYVATG